MVFQSTIWAYGLDTTSVGSVYSSKLQNLTVQVFKLWHHARLSIKSVPTPEQ